MIDRLDMLDKVRQYAKDWGIKISGLRLNRGAITHDGPSVFGIHWPTRLIVGPLARTLTDADAWYLVHEISHVLINEDPDDVDEVHSAMIAMDYYAGQHIGLSGWESWMDDFALPEMAMVARRGVDEVGDTPLLRSCEWKDVDAEVQAHLLEQSLGHAIAKGLLTEDGTPTFNRAAWMPASMLVERAAARLLRAAMLEASR